MLPPGELGSVFSLIETIAATFPLILAPLASATYTATVGKGILNMRKMTVAELLGFYKHTNKPQPSNNISLNICL